jgi:hypothetical protein
MTKQLTPLMKGLITGLVMLAISLILYYAEVSATSRWMYIVYAIYAAGILWTLIDYSRTIAYKGKFGELFSQGFRCFIVVTLIWVTFTSIFSNMHPEIKEESAKYYRENLVKDKNKTPKEIEDEVARYKKQFTTVLVATTIFGYLVLGSVFTVAGAVLLLVRRK